jgi:hypothetical protein
MALAKTKGMAMTFEAKLSEKPVDRLVHVEVSISGMMRCHAQQQQ